MPAFDAVLAQVPHEWHSDGRALALQHAFEECWHTAFNAVARKYQFTDAMFAAGNDAFSKVKVPKECEYRAYDDSSLVEHLGKRIPCYLITSGYPILQNSKVDHLGIRTWFSEFIIDPVDTNNSPGKEEIFRDLARRIGITVNDRVLVVGDNPASEIRAGNALGMDTVQVLRPGVVHSEDAAVAVGNFHELLAILGLTRSL